MALTPAVQALIKKINKEHGEGSVILGNEVINPPRFTTGSLSFDVALGGGWPANQWNEVIGEESAGKTAVCMHTVAANQQRDPNFLTLWVAAEFFNPEYAEMFGVDTDRVIVVNNHHMTTAYQAAIDFANSKEVDCIVIDSLPALVPDRPGKDLKDIGEMDPGLGALLTGQFFRMVGKATSRKSGERPVLGLMINQYREKIGVMYGDNRTTPGGKGKNFAYWTRVEVRRVEYITEKRPDAKDGKIKEIPVGQVIAAKAIKNKSAANNRVAYMDFYFAENEAGFRPGEFDTTKEVIALGILFDVLTRQGNSWYLGEEKVASNRPELVQNVYEQPDLKEEIEDRVMAIVATGKYKAEVEADDE